MPKATNFSNGVIVSSKFLNDQQQGLTGLTFGGGLSAHSSDAAKVSLSPVGHEIVAPLVLAGGTGAIGDDYVVGYREGAVHSSVASGTAGARNIWATTTSGAQSATPGTYSLSILPTADTPADAYKRKLGTAQWTGTSLQQGRLLNGVMADAIQTNMFTFKSMFDSTADIPLTLQGGAAQGSANSPLLSVGYLVSSTYAEKWVLGAKGRITTTQTSSADEHYRAFVSTDTQPSMALTGTTIKLGPGGTVAADTTIARTGVGVVKVDHTLDTVTIQNSTGTNGGIVTVADGLNVVGTLSVGGAALISTQLSDSAELARLSSPTFTGTPSGPTAAPGTSSTQFATTAFVTTVANLKADLASPTFTGAPTLPTGTTGVTQTAGNSTTALATTAFVTGAITTVSSASATSLSDGLAANATADRARANHTGTQTAATISNFDTQVRTSRLDQLAAPTGNVAMGGMKFTGLAAGTNPGESVRFEQLAPYALLASPTFSGVPLSPTAAVDTATTQIATTAYVVNQGYAKLVSPTFTGSPTLPSGTTGVTQTTGTATTQLATTAFVAATVTAASVSDASTTVKGATKLSVAPAVANNPIAVGTNDARVTADQAAGTASIRTLGTSATSAAAGNDSRLSDARTPTAHATSHKLGGADAIKLNELALPTASVPLNSQKLTGLAAGTATGEAARWDELTSGLAANATADRARANHTGTQASSTISDIADFATLGTAQTFSGVKTFTPETIFDTGMRIGVTTSSFSVLSPQLWRMYSSSGGNPLMMLNTAGLFFGDGGPSAVDTYFMRSGPGILQLGPATTFRSQVDATHAEDLVRKVQMDTVSTADRARANHSGTQLASTISDFSAAVQGIAYTEAEINTLLGTNASADRARANHTGTQTASTISDFTAAATAVAATQPVSVANTPLTSYTPSAPVTILTSTTSVAVTIPSAASWGNKLLYLKCGNLAAGQLVTLTPASGTIDGAANFVMSLPYASVILANDGTNWFAF